jgi:hypothetical protein
MNRSASLAVLVLAAALSGCPMCQTPFDYCNAVIGPGGCPNCDFGARAGSAFAPMGGTPATVPRGPTPAGHGGGSALPAQPSEKTLPEPEPDSY